MKKIPNKIKKSAPATFKEIPKNQKVKKELVVWIPSCVVAIPKDT